VSARGTTEEQWTPNERAPVRTVPVSSTFLPCLPFLRPLPARRAQQHGRRCGGFSASVAARWKATVGQSGGENEATMHRVQQITGQLAPTDAAPAASVAAQQVSNANPLKGRTRTLSGSLAQTHTVRLHAFTA
jgi:hypothetical protein